MDYDSVSGPQVKRIKNMQLHSVEEVMQKSAACAAFAAVLVSAQEFYNAKTAK